MPARICGGREGCINLQSATSCGLGQTLTCTHTSTLPCDTHCTFSTGGSIFNRMDAERNSTNSLNSRYAPSEYHPAKSEGRLDYILLQASIILDKYGLMV